MFEKPLIPILEERGLINDGEISLPDGSTVAVDTFLSMFPNKASFKVLVAHDGNRGYRTHFEKWREMEVI